MPGSARSSSSKRSSSKRIRGPSSVKTDTSNRSRVHKRMRDVDLSRKVLGYIADLPSKWGDGDIVVRSMEDFRPKQFKDLALIQASLGRSGKWPSQNDQSKAVSNEFANIVDKERGYQALGLRWKRSESKKAEEIELVDSSQVDDLVLLDIQVRHGVGYAVNIENLSAQLRLQGIHRNMQDWEQQGADHLQDRRAELKAELRRADTVLGMSWHDFRDPLKRDNDYRNGRRRCEEIQEREQNRAEARKTRIKKALDDLGPETQANRQAPSTRRDEGHIYDYQERGRPRRREDRAAFSEYARSAYQDPSRTPSFGGRDFGTRPPHSAFSPGVPPNMSRCRSMTPLGARGFSRMPSYADWHASTPYYEPKFEDETYFSQPNSRAPSMSRSRSRSVSMRGDDFMRSWDRPKSRRRRPSIWSTDSFPPPRPYRPRRSFSMPRRPSFDGGPPPLSRMPSRSMSRGGGGYRRYVNDTGSVISENSYTDDEGWKVKSFSRRKSFNGGAGNRSSMSFSTGISFH